MGVTPSPQAVIVIPALIGNNRGANMPATWDVVLGNGDPRTSGAELSSAGGYERMSLSNASSAWSGIASGLAVSDPVAPPDATGAWSDEATHIWLEDPALPGVPFAVQRLQESIVVTTAGPVPARPFVRVTDADVGVF